MPPEGMAGPRAARYEEGPMRRLGRLRFAFLLPALAVAFGAFAASCGGDSDGAWPVSSPGSGTSGGTSVGSGAPSGSDAGSGAPTGTDAEAPSSPPDAAGVPTPVSSDGGAKGDAATACALGSSGALGLVPGATMSPGLACVSCHASTGAKKLTAAGTVYTTLHEADLCLGVKSGLQVVLTDANGTDHTMNVNAVGNFYDQSLLAFATPYKAKVVSASGSVAMITPQTNTDCNACHTAAGTQGAAGRIIGP
jgi:hypothetical protein